MLVAHEHLVLQEVPLLVRPAQAGGRAMWQLHAGGVSGRLSAPQPV